MKALKAGLILKNAAMDADTQRVLSQKILRNLSRNNGKYVIPLTPAEVNRLTKTKHTWAAVTKEYPDFAKGMKEYLDNRTTKPDLKKINRLNISPEKKFNMMNGVKELGWDYLLNKALLHLHIM